MGPRSPEAGIYLLKTEAYKWNSVATRRKDARFSVSGQPVGITPGPDGAHSWIPMAYSPDTGFVHIPATEIAGHFLPVAKS
jgi:hypothetical protein